MTDLVCTECEWVEAGFDNGTEIAEYIAETDLIETHFADQDCPSCGAEKATEVFYRMCTDCFEAEPDCMCDLETLDLSEERADELRDEVMSLVQEKIEDMDMDEERRKHRFKQNDLRRIASQLIQKHFASTKEKTSEEDNQ